MSEIFPPEILTRILTRLPANTLTVFKCVSKKWNSLITTPKFISAYISAHTSASSTPPWCIVERDISLSPTESNFHSSPTHFQLAPIPNVSTFSIKPHILSPLGNPPITEPFYPYPAVVLQSSNGLLLFSLHTNRGPLKEKTISRKYPSSGFIPLPAGCTLPAPSVETALTRKIGVSGSHIHFLDLRLYEEDITDGTFLVKLRRLQDTKTGVWKLMYNVKAGDFMDTMWSLKLAGILVGFLHPYKDDTVVIYSDGYVLFYNLRTLKVEALAKSGGVDLTLHKLPLWPTSLRPTPSLLEDT